MLSETLAHFEILERIGSGGMGVVYRARDTHLDRDVAIKVLSPGRVGDESSRERLGREAKALSRLNHPNIATIYDFASEGGVDFLAMEYVPGESLHDRLASGAFPEAEVVRLGRELAEGLSAAHEEGVVHRDLKPANLRLARDGRLKILDFGLATWLRPMGEELTTASYTEDHQVVGTLPYVAPEQLRGTPPDVRTDVYAAGLVLYEMAAGKKAFSETTGPSLVARILEGAPEPLDTLERADDLSEDPIRPKDSIALAYALMGDEERSRRTLDEILASEESLRAPFALSWVYAALGEREKALEYLERAYEIRDPNLVLLQVWPPLDPIRDDPRYEELLRRMNFPP